jgi:hypothetical protein
MARPRSSEGLSNGPRPLDARLLASLFTLAHILRVLTPLILVMIGLGLGVVSLGSEQTTLYRNTYSGLAAPGNATIDLPAVSPGFLQIIETTGECDLRVYPATDAQSSQFNRTGSLPSFWMTCSNRTATVGGDVRHLILLNFRTASIPYEISVFANSIRTPLGWLALPAAAFVIIGLITFLPRMMAGEVLRMREDLEQRQEKRKERK